MLWASFKEKLGVSEFRQMLFHLGSMFPTVEGLSSLKEAFSKEEIDGPRPDGFNNEFLKGCWLLIAEHFYWLCHAFLENEICLRSINSYHITLIPKKDRPLVVSDYRPISLLNSSVKLLTKLLANRLQGVIKN